MVQDLLVLDCGKDFLMTKVLQKKDRVLESINATVEDIQNLYVATILNKVISHFQKKLLGKKDEFRKEDFELYLKHIEAVKCPIGLDRNGTGDPIVETIDGVRVSLINVLEILGERDFYNQEKLMQKLCYKYDYGKKFKIFPVFQEIIENYWLYRV